MAAAMAKAVSTAVSAVLAAITVQSAGEVDPAGPTAVVRAARLGHAESLKALVAAGASPDAADADGRTALLWAAREGHRDCVRALVAAGASPNVAESDGNTPLIWAAYYGHVGVVNALVAAGASVDLAKSDGITPLIGAAYCGHVDVVNALLVAGASRDLAGSHGSTPLIWAAQQGHVDVVNALVAAGASLDLAESDKRTPLLWAAREDHVDVVNALVAAGANLDLAEFDGSTPLLWAAWLGHVDVVNALVAAGASLNLAESHGSTPLHWAARAGNVDVVNALVAAGASLDLTDSEGWTALLWAARKGHVDVVKVLAVAGATLNLAEPNGSTPLLWAAREGHVGVVKALVAAGASLDLADSEGWTALLWAARNGHVDVVSVLAVAGASLDLAEPDGSTPLHWAAREHHVDVVNALVAAGASLDLADSRGGTALCRAAWPRKESQESQKASVRALLAAGARLDTADSRSNAALAQVCNGDAEGVQALLAMGANLDLAHACGMTALMWAAYAGCTECVEALVATGARLDLADVQEETALHWAVQHGHTQCVKELVAAGASLDRTDCDGYTALCNAAFYGDLESVKVLVAAGAGLDLADVSGTTPLSWAVWNGNTEIVKVLVAAGAGLDLANAHGLTALMSAVNLHRTEIVKVLVAAGASQACPGGRTMLMLAAEAGYKSAVKVLLAAGADRWALSNTGETAAMLARDLETARLVVGNDTGITRLMLSAVGGHELGKVSRSQLHKRDALGRTALMWAATGGDTETLRELLRLGSNVDARDFAGRQARDYAVLYSHGALLPELPPTAPQSQHLSNIHRPEFAAAVALCCVAAFAALANARRRGRRGHYIRVSTGEPLVGAGLGRKHTSEQPSRGAVLAAATKCSEKKWAKAARAFRFVEVLCCCVLPMRIMLLVRPRVWLPILALAHLPALLWSNRSLGSLLRKPLVLQLVTTHHSLLWGTWSGKACACTALGLLRVLVLLSLAAIASQGPRLPWRNQQGELATAFLRATPQEVYCTGLNLTDALTWFNTTPWTVASGRCTMDGAGCILSPGFPDPYPRSTCTIDVSLPLFLVEATDFDTDSPLCKSGGGGHLSMGGQVYADTHGPNASFPGRRIEWQSGVYDFCLGDAGQHWRICPGHELCVPLPPVWPTWLLLNWCGAVLVCCWVIAAATILLRTSRRLNDAPPSPSSSTESPTSSSASSAVSASSPATSGSWASASTSLEGTEPSDNEGVRQEVMQHAQLVEIALQGGDMATLHECATLSGPGSLLFTAFMLTRDVFFDAFSINTLLLNADILFAGCLAAAAAWSTTSHIASGSLCALPREFRRTLATGVPTDGWLDFLDGERGTQALVSLLVTTYGLPFATRTALGMVLGPLSIVASTWGLATFVHEYVDLSVEEER